MGKAESVFAIVKEGRVAMNFNVKERETLIEDLANPVNSHPGFFFQTVRLHLLLSSRH